MGLEAAMAAAEEAAQQHPLRPAAGWVVWGQAPQWVPRRSRWAGKRS